MSETDRPKYFVNSRQYVDGVTVVFPNGNIGHGKDIEAANYSAAFFPLPEAASPKAEEGWHQLDNEGIKVFSRKNKTDQSL